MWYTKHKQISWADMLTPIIVIIISTQKNVLTPDQKYTNETGEFFWDNWAGRESFWVYGAWQASLREPKINTRGLSKIYRAGHQDAKDTRASRGRWPKERNRNWRRRRHRSTVLRWLFGKSILPVSALL